MNSPALKIVLPLILFCNQVVIAQVQNVRAVDSVAESAEHSLAANRCCQGCIDFPCDGRWKRARCFYRSHAPGTLNQRYPYEAFRMYYYDRPYNAHHVDERIKHPVSQFSPNHLPYSHNVFESVYDQIEPRIIDELHLKYSDLTSAETIREQIARDRNLEYVDWSLHRDRRIVWERRRDEEKLRELEPENQLESQPVSNPKLKFDSERFRHSPIHSAGENSR